jgi:N-acetylmuramoyl-L-alanine amidase
MKIIDHRVKKGAFVQAHACGGALNNPTLIILHDTANRAQPGETVRWFSSKECKTSAHFVVERDGKIIQMVDLDRKAYHAGVSAFKGKPGCNSFAIGIEIDNPGKLTKEGKAWFHKKTDAGYQGTVHKATKEHGDGYWLPYTEKQIHAVTELCDALAEAYPSIQDIATHWIVSPGRKVDTNPLFPLEEVRKAVFGAGELLRSPEVIPAAPSKTENLVAVAKVAAKSQTVWMQIATPVLVVWGYASDGAQWMFDAVLSFTAQLPGLANDTETALGTARQFSGWLGLPFAKISLAIVVGFCGFSIFRHVRDKLHARAAP